MADGRHFENRYIAISQQKSSDFDEILYTAEYFELDERHVINNKKVALDRIRVRQNLFLVLKKKLSCCRESARCFMSLNNSITHSKSLKVIQTGTIQKLFYSHSIVTVALSCIISEMKLDICRKLPPAFDTPLGGPRRKMPYRLVLKN